MAETPNEDEVTRVRAQGRQILSSLKDDPAFLAEIRKDPTGALVSRGIPEAAALDWQKKPSGDVGGYEFDPSCSYSCTDSNTDCYGTVYY